MSVRVSLPILAFFPFLALASPPSGRVNGSNLLARFVQFTHFGQFDYALNFLNMTEPLHALLSAGYCLLIVATCARPLAVVAVIGIT